MTAPLSPLKLAQLRLAVLKALSNEVDAAWKQAREDAEPLFRADAVENDASQLRPKLDGEPLGLITVNAGERTVEVHEDQLTAWAKLHQEQAYHWYIDPTVLQMERVIKLIRDTYPELADWRIRSTWRASQLKVAAAKKGWVTDRKTEDTMKIATVTTGDPTGEFRYVPGDSHEVILRAWRDGRLPAEVMDGLGRLALPAPPAPAADPEVPLTGQVLPWSDPAHQEEIARKLNLLMEVTGHNHPGGGYTHDPATNEVQCSCGAVLIKSWADATGGQAAA